MAINSTTAHNNLFLFQIECARSFYLFLFSISQFQSQLLQASLMSAGERKCVFFLLYWAYRWQEMSREESTLITFFSVFTSSDQFAASFIWLLENELLLFSTLSMLLLLFCKL